jgi:hypothetical protein
MGHDSAIEITRDNSRRCQAWHRDCRARRGPRGGVVGSGKQSLARYFLHQRRRVKSSHAPVSPYNYCDDSARSAGP